MTRSRDVAAALLLVIAPSGTHGHQQAKARKEGY